MKGKSAVPTRHASPPIIICFCPGGGGHEWAELNPVWYGKHPGKSVEAFAKKRWCPLHEEEHQQLTNSKISALTQERMRAYSELPLAETRMCWSENPTTHPKRAVLPARKFYRRKTRKKIDGSQGIALDSHCKECRRAEAVERRSRRMGEDLEKWQKASAARNRRYREKKKKQREMLEKEGDKQMPLGPFREWLLEYSRVTKLQPEDIARNTGVDGAVLRRCMNNGEKTHVALSTVDKVGMAHGRVSLTIDLYPPEGNDE